MMNLNAGMVLGAISKSVIVMETMIALTKVTKKIVQVKPFHKICTDTVKS